MAVLDSIVNVNISLSQALAPVETYGRMVIFAPKAASGTQDTFKWYNSIAEITAAGWLTTEDAYKAAAVAFDNGANGVYILKYNNELTEAIPALLNTALNNGDWYGIVATMTTSTLLMTVATWCNTNHKLFGFTLADNADLPAITSDYVYAFVYPNASMPTFGAYLHVAAMAKCFTYAPGTETWAYKTLESVGVSSYTEAQVATQLAKNCNVYTQIGGKNVTYNGITLGGEWIDIMRYVDYLASAIQQSVYSLLSASVKVPYNAAGLVAIGAAIQKVLAKGQADGAIDSTDYADDGTVIPGYTVTLPDMADISSATRATRVLSGVKFTARLTGAIHTVQIEGTLTE